MICPVIWSFDRLSGGMIYMFYMISYGLSRDDTIINCGFKNDKWQPVGESHISYARFSRLLHA